MISYRILYAEKGEPMVMVGDQQHDARRPFLPDLDPATWPWRINQVCNLGDRSYFVLSREDNGRDPQYHPAQRLLLLDGQRSWRMLSDASISDFKLNTDAGAVYTEHWRVDAIWPADERRAFCIISRGPVKPPTLSGRLAVVQESLPFPVAPGHLTWFATQIAPPFSAQDAKR